MMSLPVIGDPGSAEHVGGVPRSDLPGSRKSALRRQVAANSRVGAGIAALWGWDSMLQGLCGRVQVSCDRVGV